MQLSVRRRDDLRRGNVFLNVSVQILRHAYELVIGTGILLDVMWRVPALPVGNLGISFRDRCDEVDQMLVASSSVRIQIAGRIARALIVVAARIVGLGTRP